LSSPFFINEVEKNLRGIAYKGLNLNLLNNFLIPLPPFQEQLKIVERIETLFKLCDELELKIKKSQQQNIEFLQQIFREALGIKSYIEEPQKETAKIESRKSKFDPNTKLMEIVELLKKHGKLHAEELWKMSKFPDDIDAFYSDLKKQIELNKLVKESTEKGYLELA
jgi:restriction endonuclease S subunit